MGTQDDINWIKDKLEMIERCLIGDIENDKAGVMQRLKTLEDHSKCVKRITWAGASLIGGIIITALIKLVMIK